MQELHAINPLHAAIILTRPRHHRKCSRAMQKGAYNYLTKPFQPEDRLPDLSAPSKTGG